MTAGQQRWLAHRLHGFVVSACTDPAFQRDLGRNTQLALERHGLRWDPPTRGLSWRPVVTSIGLDQETLFGTAMPPVSHQPPAAERLESKLCLARAKALLLDHGPESYAAQAVRWYGAHGMTALLSPYEFVPAPDPGKGGYTNSLSQLRPATPGSGAWRSILAGWDSERVLLAWLCLLFQWDELLGSLLDYAPCCTAAFGKRWPRASQQHAGDVAPLILEELCPGGGFAGCFPWENNIFVRYFGCEIIQHFPCRLDCPASAARARRNMAAWSAFEPAAAEETLRRLMSPVLFTRTGGVACFSDAHLRADGASAELDFDVDRLLMTAADSELERMLHRCAGHLAASPAGLHAGGEPVEGWLIEFQNCGAMRRS